MLASNFGRLEIVKYLIEHIHYQQINKLNNVGYELKYSLIVIILCLG